MITLKKMIIKGGKRLNGSVSVSGSKNATLPIMAASILGNSPSIIHNVPLLADVRTMGHLLKLLGASVGYENHKMIINPKGINNYKAPYELVKTMRASIYVLGPLVAKYGWAKVSLPGGCAIGARPIDLHIKGLRKLGAKIEMEHGYVKASAKKLKGARIVFDKVSLGATVNIMLAAVLADGETILENSSKEPEIIDTVGYLKSMGAKISGEGTDCLVIKGVKKLKGVDGYSIIPDRIEAATLIAAGVVTKGCVKVKKVNPEHLAMFLDKLKEAGAVLKTGKNSVEVCRHRGRLKSVDIITEPYPGFPTDIQAQWMALMSLAKGDSVIKENIWENRFMHVMELVRMGSDIKIDENTAVVTGVSALSGADVMASDLRASAALIIAGLAASGETVVRRIYHLERGYEKLDEKLKKLGADIRVEMEAAV